MRAIVVGVVFALWALCPALSDDPRLAIKGYDPVAYFIEGKARLGTPDFEYRWDGVRYRFASASNMDAFKLDPDRFAPQFGGSCTASLAKGRKIEADPLNWSIVNGRLFLFASPAGPALFNQDAAAVEARARANWAAPVREGS